MTLPLPDPLIVRHRDEPLSGEDQDRRVSPWGVQRDLDALAQAFPLVAGSQNFAEVPQCRAYHDTTQSIPDNTTTTVALNNERWDKGYPLSGSPHHDNSTNNSRLTCRVPGLYAMVGQLSYDTNATGVRLARIRVNGTTNIADVQVGAVTGTATKVVVPTQWRLAVGDYVELIAFQTSGGALDVTVEASLSPEFSFHWVSP